jgi:hypothetical protein
MSDLILDPDLAICDPHHHLWDLPNRKARYMTVAQDGSI